MNNLEVYEKLGFFIDGALYAKELGNKERAEKLFLRAMEQYESMGYYEEIHEIGKKFGFL